MAKYIKLTPDQRSFGAGQVAELLATRGDTGASEGEIKNRITSALHLSVFPKPDFGKILFVARVKKVSGRYYLMGTGPEKPDEEKTWKVKKPKHQVNNQPNADKQSITFEGDDLETIIKGKGVNFKSLVKKVTVWFNLM